MPGDDPTVAVETAAGERFEIALEAVPTSGFEWQPDLPEDETRIELVGATEEAATRPLGASAVRRFTFLAHEPGEVEIRFLLRRPWESKPPVDERRIRVAIRS